MGENSIITTQRAAEMLGVSVSSVYRMEKNGILHPIRTPGGQRRFELDEIESYKKNSVNIVAPQKPYHEVGGQLSFISQGVEIEEVMPEQISVGKIEEKEKEVRKEVDKRNTLNDLNGTEWLLETKSFFYQKGLGSKHPHAQIERQHPAPYSFQDIEHLVAFFTKRGMEVLDPFGGVGSTAKACALEGRVCTSIELSEKWHRLAIERLNFEVSEGEAEKHNLINGDTREVLKMYEDNVFDFVVTSPPYWSILNKKADYKVKKERLSNNLATNYSDNDENDLANIGDYNAFLDVLVDDVFMQCARVLKPKKYMCLVVSDFRNKSDYISFHSDLIQHLNKRQIDEKMGLHLQGTKILLQNHKSLLPYGYPFAYVENIHHQYVLIFRKDKI